MQSQSNTVEDGDRGEKMGKVKSKRKLLEKNSKKKRHLPAKEKKSCGDHQRTKHPVNSARSKTNGGRRHEFARVSFIFMLKDARLLKYRLKAGQTRNLCHWRRVPSSCFHRANVHLSPYSSARVSYEVLSKASSLFSIIL